MLPSRISSKRILWIALFRGIGDAILFYPTLRRCGEVFPEAEIGVLAFRPAIETVLRLYGFGGKVWVQPASPLGWPLRIAQIGLRRYDIIFDASSMDPMHLSRWLSWLFSKGDRVGYHYGSSSWLYNKRLSTRPIAEDHEKDIFAQLLQPYAYVEPMQIVAPNTIVCKTSANLPPCLGKRIVMHLGARDPAGQFTKCWPIPCYMELVKRLANDKSIQIVILGEEKERAALEEYFSMLAACGVVNLAAQVSIVQHFGIISSADLFIGNNSGPLHIAAAYGIPLITFAGGVPMRRWGPPVSDKNIVLGLDKLCPDCQEWYCEKHGIPCLEAISVDEAFDAAQKLLDGGRYARKPGATPLPQRGIGVDN
jgi:ADP-heptose:LPS heptosyltransferase